jgi:ribonuclease VapC
VTDRFGCVLDASALLAVLNREPGAERVAPLLDGAVMSCVNWSEVLQKSAMHGVETGELGADIEGLGVTFVPFMADDAEETARLWPLTRSAGLSLGDRACLALAARESLPAVTTDRNWATLALDVRVVVIR